MTSKRQFIAQVARLKDELLFERAKVRASAKIIERVVAAHDQETMQQGQAYWFGYHKGKQDAAQGSLPYNSFVQ